MLKTSEPRTAISMRPKLLYPVVYFLVAFVVTMGSILGFSHVTNLAAKMTVLSSGLFLAGSTLLKSGQLFVYRISIDRSGNILARTIQGTVLINPAVLTKIEIYAPNPRDIGLVLSNQTLTMRIPIDTLSKRDVANLLDSIRPHLPRDIVMNSEARKMFAV